MEEIGKETASGAPAGHSVQSPEVTRLILSAVHCKRKISEMDGVSDLCELLIQHTTRRAITI